MPSDDESDDENQPPKAIRELHSWLHGNDPTPSFTFFTRSPPFALRDLQVALKGAVKEIALKWDPQLECMFAAARDEEHCIILDENEFLEGRVLAVEELVDMGDRVLNLNRERVVQLLEMCRDEIQWEKQEIRRLEVHCDIARVQKQERLRESFRYRPLPRPERDVVPGIGVIGGEDRRDSALDQEDIKREAGYEDEVEDEEMLEADRDDERDDLGEGEMEGVEQSAGGFIKS